MTFWSHYLKCLSQLPAVIVGFCFDRFPLAWRASCGTCERFSASVYLGTPFITLIFEGLFCQVLSSGLRDFRFTFGFLQPSFLCLLASVAFDTESRVILTAASLNLLCLFFPLSPLRTFYFWFSANMLPCVFSLNVSSLGFAELFGSVVGVFSSLCKILTYPLFRYFFCFIIFFLPFESPVSGMWDLLILSHRSLIFFSIIFFSRNFSLRFDSDDFYWCDFKLKNSPFSCVQAGVQQIQ